MGESSPLSGGYLLIVLAEPHSEQHKEILLQRLAKGLASWDGPGTEIDIESELRNIATQCPQGEELRSGEKLVQLASDSLVTEILIHPQLSTLKQCIRNLLASFTRHRHVIHAGYTLSGCGSWVVQDGIYQLADFQAILQDSEVQKLYKAYESSITTDLHCAPEGQWSPEQFNQDPAIKSAKISVNPAERWTSNNEAASAFLRYISDIVPSVTLERLLEPSDVVGNIRFSHPTLYVFPGGQGDSALFGISGFNILVDGGFGRKPCFWDFTRHLDRLDAVVMTRNNPSSLSGLTGAICRKATSPVYPQIGHVFCNLPTEHDNNSGPSPSDDPLMIHLTDLCRAMTAGLGALQLKSQPLYRTASLQPINLYHKVGHGTLDMYVISPSPDCAEVKELIRLWRGGRGEEAAGNAYRTVKMGGKEFRIPLLDLVSVCALLVWQPADPCEPVTRLLFPGSAPQHKILEGLEILKPHLEYLKSPVCLIKNLTATVQPRSRSPVKAKTSPRHTAAAAAPIPAAAPKKKEVEANKATSTPRPAKSAEVKVKAVDSAALMSSSSSRAGSGELRVVKKTEAKTVSNSKPLANKKDPAASISSNVGETAKKIVKKEVEAKVQSFKNSASLKRAEENNKLVKKETESTATTRTRSQSQKRSASSTRAGNDENKPVTIKSIKKVTTESTSGSPAKTPPKPPALAVKLNSNKGKETTTKSSSSASKEIKKEKPKSSTKTTKETAAPAAPKSAAPAPPAGSRAVKRPAKTTAAALVATTAATVAVAIPHEEEDGQPPVEEVVFGSEEAAQAASSPVKSQQGDEVEGAAADPVDIESQILQADEDEQLQVELEETAAAGEEEMEEEEDKEGITIDAEEVNNGSSDAAAGADGVEPVEPEEEEEEGEEERQTEVDPVVQEAEENEIIDTQEVMEEDQGEQHQSETEEDIQQESASPAFQADESAEPEDENEGEQEDNIKETAIDPSEVEFTAGTQFPQATTDADESEKQVYSAADDEGEEDNASSTAADGHDKADSVVGSMQVAQHQQLSDSNDDNDPESTLADESKVDSLITEEKEEDDEPQSQPDEFTFTETNAPAQSEKYPQGKDPLERNTPYVIVSASSATTSNEEVNEEEFTAEIIQRPVVVPDPDLVTPQPPPPGVKNSEEVVKVIRPKAPEQLDDDSADEVEEETFQQEIKTKDSAVPILPEDEKKAPGSSAPHHEDDNTKEEEKKQELVVALPPEEPAKKTESSKLMAEQKVSVVDDDDAHSASKTEVVKHQADSFSDEELERDAESTTEEEKLSGPSDDEEAAEEEEFVSKLDVKHSVESAPPSRKLSDSDIIKTVVSATTSVEAQFHPEPAQEDVELDAHEENQTFVTSVDVKGDLTEAAQLPDQEEEEENIPAVLESSTEPDHQPDEDESVEAKETSVIRIPFTAPLTASTPIDGPDVIEIQTFQQLSAKEIDDDLKETIDRDEIALPVQKDEIIEDLSQVTVASIPSNPAEHSSSSKVGVEMELESAKDEEPCLVTNRDAAKEIESIKPVVAELEDIKKEIDEVKEEEAFMKNVQEVEAISIAVKEDVILNKDIAEVKEDKVVLDSAKETILVVKENINMILKEVQEEKGSISIVIKGETPVSTMKEDVISQKDVKEIEEARSTIKDIKEEILMAVKNEKVVEETAAEEIPVQAEPIKPITQDVKVEKESLKEDSNLQVDEKPSEPSVIPPKVTEDAHSSTKDVIVPPESDAVIQSSTVEIQLDGKVCQLKPEDALDSGPSSASVTPKSPLSPNPVRRPMDDETAIVKDVAKPSSSIDSDVRSTTSSSSWNSERVEREVEEDDDTLMPSVAPSYLAGYEGVSVGVSKLSTIASSDGEQQPPSMESNASSKTYEKLMNQPARQQEESAFSSGPSSWDAEREQQLASKPMSSFVVDSDQSATSSLTSNDEPSSRVPLMKPSTDSPIPPASPRDSESNKDSLSSIPTSTDEPITIVPSKREVMDCSISPVPTSSPFGVIDSSEIKRETHTSSIESKKESLSETSISPVPPSSPLNIEQSSKHDLDDKKDSISSTPTPAEPEEEVLESSVSPVLASSLLKTEQCATKDDSEAKKDTISSSPASAEPKKESTESSISPVPSSTPYNIERSSSRGDSMANIQASVEPKKESIETSASPVPPSSPFSIERSSSRGDSEASKDSIQSIPTCVEPKKEVIESSISPVPPSSPYSIERSSSRGDSEASKDSIQSIPASVEVKKETIETSNSPVPSSSPFNIERSSSRGDSEASKDSIQSIPASVELKREPIETSISPVPSSSPFSIERSSSRGESEAIKDSIQSIPTSAEPKKELIEGSISPIPSSSPFSIERSSSRGDSEANKDSLSSIQTTGSSDYQLETKVDDSASGCSTHSDYSDQHQQPHLQRVSTPQSDISSASESTTSQLIQPMDLHQSSSASSKVELVDPKLAPHNLWLKEKEERASSNPFSDRYEDDSALPDPLMDEMMAPVPAANYYAGVGHHSDDVDSDRQSDSQYPDDMAYTGQQLAYDESGKDAEGYLYESEQDDNYLAYSAEDCYHGDHQNGNSYDYHEPSTIQGFSHHQGGSIQQQQQQNANQDLNRNNDPPRDQTAPELSRQELAGHRDERTAAPSAQISPQPQQHSQHEETLASWGKPLNLPTPIAPSVNGNATGSPLKRPASNGNSKSNGSAPFYVDLAYIPHHSDPRYSDVEFFRRIRARHYVLSALEPSPKVLDALLEGKQSWTGDDKDLDVTIIPTYDSEALAVWVSANEDMLARNRIDLAPSASRCTINLQDHETSCSAYRLEF